MDKEKKQVLLHWGQYGIRAYIWMQTVILIIWSVFSLVPGVGNVLKETEIGFHCVSHLGFWLAFEIFLITIGGTVISLNSKAKVMSNVIILYLITLLIGIGANIIHIVASCMELYRCSSIVCMNTPGILCTLIILYVSLAIIETMIVYMAYQYRIYVGINLKQK